MRAGFWFRVLYQQKVQKSLRVLFNGHALREAMDSAVPKKQQITLAPT
jgi:hypothetical protein